MCKRASFGHSLTFKLATGVCFGIAKCRDLFRASPVCGLGGFMCCLVNPNDHFYVVTFGSFNLPSESISLASEVPP